jgi:hypothetical protein
MKSYAFATLAACSMSSRLTSSLAYVSSQIQVTLMYEATYVFMFSPNQTMGYALVHCAAEKNRLLTDDGDVAP